MYEFISSSEGQSSPLNDVLGHMETVGNVLRDAPYDPKLLMNSVDIHGLGKAQWTKQDNKKGGTSMGVRIFQTESLGINSGKVIDCKFDITEHGCLLANDMNAMTLSSWTYEKDRLQNRQFDLKLDSGGEFICSHQDKDSLTPQDLEEFKTIARDFAAAVGAMR